MLKSKTFSVLLFLTGGLIILLNLTTTTAFNQQPGYASTETNALYYGISRPTFTFGVFLILMSLFCGHLNWFKGILSGSNIRLLAKSLIISCVVELLCVQYLYCGESAPLGIFVSQSIAMQLGFGLLIATPLVSIVLMYFVEFPILRLM